MSAKKWLLAFALTVVFLLGGLCAFNGLVDPFGIFGDPILKWDAYNMTQNPRASKIAYLEEHHQEFDSYVVGCSSSSSFPTEALNAHFDAEFYNMIMYGADLLDVEQQSRYLIENYTCKNLVVSLYIDNGLHYDTEPDAYTYSMHPKADGTSEAAYYLKYLFAKPTYAIDKLISLQKNTYLKDSFDAFDPSDGTYDKRTRDVEVISDLETYYADFPGFADYPVTQPVMTAIEETAESLARIKSLCEENNVNLTVVMVPVYWEYFDDFQRADVETFYRSIAAVTEFWDFSMSSISYDARYFYDETHFRNDVGEMAITRMGGREDLYVPADFGCLVDAQNVDARLEEIYTSVKAADPADYTVRLPVLMYHHLEEGTDGSNSMIVSPETFRAQLTALQEAGYTAVSIEELQAYVEGAPLPEKPVLITFDDGYLSNYTLAFPILKELNMKATIFAVGSSWGKSTYKDTGNAIYPHFGTAEAEEMTASGLISIQSHTYDLHQAAQYETGPVYEDVLRLEGESEEAYVERLRADHQQMTALLGEMPTAVALPHGRSDALADTVLAEEGIEVTFNTTVGVNTVVRGLPQSLRNLKRFTVTEPDTPESLLSLIQ